MTRKAAINLIRVVDNSFSPSVVTLRPGFVSFSSKTRIRKNIFLAVYLPRLYAYKNKWEHIMSLGVGWMVVSKSFQRLSAKSVLGTSDREKSRTTARSQARIQKQHATSQRPRVIVGGSWRWITTDTTEHPTPRHHQAPCDSRGDSDWSRHANGQRSQMNRSNLQHARDCFILRH